MTSARDAYDMFSGRDRGRFGDNEQRDDAVRGNDSVRSNLADVDVVLHHGTARAVLVSLTGDEARAVWLPRSLIEIEHKVGKSRGVTRFGQTVELATATVTLPASLAKQKGLT